MNADAIPDAVKQFLFENIDSVEQLDVMLYLWARRDRSWTATQIGDDLRSNHTSVERRLAPLMACGVVQKLAGLVETYCAAAVTPDQEQMLNALALAYKVHKFRILEIIFSPTKRARALADAFRIKLRKGDGDG